MLVLRYIYSSCFSNEKVLCLEMHNLFERTLNRRDAAYTSEQFLINLSQLFLTYTTRRKRYNEGSDIIFNSTNSWRQKSDGLPPNLLLLFFLADKHSFEVLRKTPKYNSIFNYWLDMSIIIYFYSYVNTSSKITNNIADRVQSEHQIIHMTFKLKSMTTFKNLTVSFTGTDFSLHLTHLQRFDNWLNLDCMIVLFLSFSCK